jgi:hypothetical protein
VKDEKPKVDIYKEAKETNIKYKEKRERCKEHSSL